MANKQTAGLQLIDFKGIDMAQGPQTIKGIYQQVIANKFIKTITNLVYDGYCYDDFPITLTTSDGLTYTGKYIDTVSSEMLQWLSITINNKSEVTVTKELFEGGGGGYEEIPLSKFKSNPLLADLIIFNSPNRINFNMLIKYKYNSENINSISNIEYNEDGSIKSISTVDKYALLATMNHSTKLGDYPTLNEGPHLFYFNTSTKFKYFSDSTKEVISDPIYTNDYGIAFVLKYRAGSFYIKTSDYVMKHGSEFISFGQSLSVSDSYIKIYRNKNKTKLLESL